MTTNEEVYRRLAEARKEELEKLRLQLTAANNTIVVLRAEIRQLKEKVCGK